MDGDALGAGCRFACRNGQGSDIMVWRAVTFLAAWVDGKAFPPLDSKKLACVSHLK